MGESIEFEAKPAFALPVGTTIGGYSIRRMIGKGGFGITYEAFNRVTHKEVAIKEFFPTGIAWRDGHSHLSYSRADSDTIGWALRKFEVTTTTLCDLEHKNIVQVHDYVPFNDTGYMIMELLDGQTLQHWLDSRVRPPSFDELRTVLDPVMEALSFVHGKGLVHRDIAPDNILITESGRPVLIDFGSVSRDLTYARAATHPGTKGVWKRHYTAPEQIQANAWPTPQADIYSLGAVIYRALTGTQPADGDERKHKSFLGEADPYWPMAERLPTNLPMTTAAAVDKALSLRAERRFSSIAEFREAMERRVSPPPPPPPPPKQGGNPPEDQKKPPLQNQLMTLPTPAPAPSMAKWIIVGGVLVVLALVGGVLGGKLISDNTRQQDELRQQLDQAQRDTKAAQQHQAEAEQATTAANRQAEAAQQQAEAQRQEATRQAEARQAEAARRAEAVQQGEAVRQAEEEQRRRNLSIDPPRSQPSLQDRAESAASAFYARHSYSAGDSLASLASLYPATAPITINGTSRTAGEQIAALEGYYKQRRYTSFNIAVVPGSLTFDCGAPERCIVTGQTRASYQTEGNADSRSTVSNFCLRFDLRGSPKVVSESAVKVGKQATCE